MGARLPLIIVGAVSMFASFLFPALYCNIHDTFFGVQIRGEFYYWIYGIFHTTILKENIVGQTYKATYIGFEPDILGVTCMLIIIVGGILALALGCGTEHKAAAIGGTLGIVGMISFYVGVLMASPLTPLSLITKSGYIFLPFVGFFICVGGGILALVGGILEKY